ncbi:MAG: quinone-dependent dihydroorotate dehydrogenase [Gammaproteobacteria bacterium]
MWYKSIIRPLLFCLDPELAHDVALKGLRYAAPLLSKTPAGKATQVMGITFPNRVGLSAGLDKNGDYILALSKLGFGFIEVGTVVPLPQAGNPRPRLFRLTERHALINRMGFNSKGLEYCICRIEKLNRQIILGVNIGKNLQTPVERAVDDYIICMRRVYPHASYITINISSPNTPGLRQLQQEQQLRQLLQDLKHEQHQLHQQFERYVPLAVKIAPDLTDKEIINMADIFVECNIDGVIATNTALSRRAVMGMRHAQEIGGLSGEPIFDSSTHVLEVLAQRLAGKIPLMGVGGIHDEQTARQKIAAGAELIQIYTGLIYEGPELVRRLVNALN